MQKALFVLLMWVSGWCSQALAQPQETRVALVIGNGSYKNSPLKNPVNDARDMAAKLRGLGFTVIERNNLVVKQIGGTLREFRSKLTPGSVALVYYAGHGLQIKGDNYFPTVDAEISGEEDVPNQSLAMRQIMDILGDAKTRLNLVFLDACRDNPYSRSFRSASKGLSKENAPSGTLISFATRPGSVAADGLGRNGLYTGALLEAMDNKGQPIEQVLKRVVTSVKAGSRNQQEPWMEGSIEGDFCFGDCTSTVQVGISDDRALWESVKDSSDVNELKVYLAQFPRGVFAGLANARIESEQQRVAKINEKKLAEERAKEVAEKKATLFAEAEQSKKLQQAQVIKEKESTQSLTKPGMAGASGDEKLKRMQGMAGASGDENGIGSALKSAGPSPSYAGRIRSRIKPNITFKEYVAGNPKAEVEVRTSPDGTIISRKLMSSSGNKAWDEAVLKAIDNTATLPRDEDGRVPPVLEISFRPKD